MAKVLSINLGDIHKNLILPKGTNVTKETLKGLHEKFKTSGIRKIASTSVFRDMKKILKEKNYSPLFRDHETAEKVLRYLEQISYPEEIFLELEYLKKKSIFTYHHSLATTIIVTRIALDFVFYHDLITEIASANLTKDIGMSRLSKTLIQNTDFLSREEYETIKEHTLWGLILLIYYLGEGLNALIAYRHHERGLHDDKFKFLDLVVAVDIFNALISPRPFRKKPYNIRGALDLLTEMGEKKEVNLEMVKRIIAAYREEYQPPEEITLSKEKLGFIPDDNFYGVKDL